jgi:hypothetical protein
MALCNKIIIVIATNKRKKIFGTRIKSAIPKGAIERVTSQ